jgi:hypothetical protein
MIETMNKQLIKNSQSISSDIFHKMITTRMLINFIWNSFKRVSLVSCRRMRYLMLSGTFLFDEEP